MCIRDRDGNNDTVILKLNETLESSDVITLRNKVLKVTVKGVPEIARVTLKEENNQWVIQTTGSNLAKVLEVQGIDKLNVMTNNVFEIATTLGIEAARNALIFELKSTLENQGLEVDDRYLMLVSDLMCHKGYLQQIGRHGIAGSKAVSYTHLTLPTIYSV